MVIIHRVTDLGAYENVSDRELQDELAAKVGEAIMLIDSGNLHKLDRSTLIVALNLLDVMCITMTQE